MSPILIIIAMIAIMIFLLIGYSMYIASLQKQADQQAAVFQQMQMLANAK